MIVDLTLKFSKSVQLNFFNKMNKTVTVLVERRVKHPLYGKFVRRSTKIHAHDEKNECRIGDTVMVIQCRPLSKTKSWRFIQLIERPK